jgi:CheY-like chemotaxis protein
MATILVIEDDNELREELVDRLELEGFQMLQAMNGVVGVGLAKAHRPDLILCDVQMPLLDGYGVLMQLTTDPATRNIPFIFISARVDAESQRQGLELGAKAYLFKPFTFQALIGVIMSHVATGLVH